MNIVRQIALILTIIGGINWGLIGFFGFNLVSFIFGEAGILTQIIYMLVGISAVIAILDLPYCREKIGE